MLDVGPRVTLGCQTLGPAGLDGVSTSTSAGELLDVAAADGADLEPVAAHLQVGLQLAFRDELRDVVGTPDRVVQHGRKRYIADLKTGSIEWGPAIRGCVDQEERQVRRRTADWLIPLSAFAEALLRSEYQEPQAGPAS